MIETNLDHAKRYDFFDILDFVKYATEGPKPENERCSRKESSESYNKWCGGTWSDAVKQATMGNPEMVKQFFEGVNVIRAMIEDERPGEFRDVTGEYFDVADFLSGEPEVFRRKDKVEQKPVVPVYANFSMSCGVEPEIIRNRGCGVIALCDELSNSGFIVDLHLVEACRNVFPIGKCYTNIKVSIDPLDLDTAAFIIANPLCLRRIWFGFLEHATNRTSCGGYGSLIEYDLQDVFEAGVSGFYFTSSAHSVFRKKNYRTLDSTKAHILAMIEEFKESPEQVVLG